MKEKDVVVIFCPPVSLYPKKPDDISEATKEPCPVCHELMWFSEKKKLMKAISENLQKNIIHECHACFEKRMENDPDLLLNNHLINI